MTTAIAKTNGNDAPTAMMQQYLMLRAQAAPSLLLFRLGDFYELFLRDAEIASAVLDIALTSRGEHGGKPLPMCGVPVHSAELYIARLVKAGHSVAIAEQMEDPAAARKRGQKAVVRREIVRVLTAGTLTEERLLEGRRSNWLLAVFPGADESAGGKAGLAWADISTGDFFLGAVPAAGLEEARARIAAAEEIRPAVEEAGAANASAATAPAGVDTGHGWTEIAARHFDSMAAAKRLRQLAGVETLDSLGEFPRVALAAAGGLLAHVDQTARSATVLLKPPQLVAPAATLAIDAATRKSLELVDGPASLLRTIDLCVTAAGGRLLAAELAAPSRQRPLIEARLDLVQWFLDGDSLRAEVRRLLRAAPDLARALARIVAGRERPRDLGAIRAGLVLAADLRARLLRAAEEGAPAMLADLVARLAPPADLVADLVAALAEDLPANFADGGLVRAGYDSRLDEERGLRRDGHQALAAMEAHLRDETGVAGLKLRHNQVLGYFVEASKKAAAELQARPRFRHRQTMGTSIRFDTPELNDLATRIAAAESEAAAIEAQHLARLAAAIAGAAPAIGAVADALAALDRSAALAELAARHGWVRPELTDGVDFAITSGRHPVVEEALAAEGKAFVPNPCCLEGAARLWLVTGPNMGGKSTFLRQNALIVVLAQMGSFVPALAARIGLVDRLYSRVGASDSLAEGRSTFMVEMVETAAILRGASERSLLLLDEVGRGTATFDGLALAWAVLEDIHDRIGARCLFASHYHELAELSGRLRGLALRSFGARQWRGELVFLHEVKDGAASRSFGLDVARLAGVPKAVLARAAAILGRLEQGERGAAREALSSLPLFAPHGERDGGAGVPGVGLPDDSLAARLAALNLDLLSPRAALDLLYQWKEEGRDQAT